MVKETNTKIYSDNGHHTIYLRKAFVTDSAFPFKVGEELIIRIEGDRVVLEKVEKSG